MWAVVRGGFTVLAAAIALAACAVLPPPSEPALEGEWAVRHIAAEAVVESSGLVASPTHPGLFWTHNDSGDVARLFAIDAAGELVGEFRVEGAAHRDWEDITADDAGYLYVGDFGNNDNARRDLVVYRIAEPDPYAARSVARVDRVLRFRYADQSAYPGEGQRNFDAEALFWMDGALYLFTKHRSDTDTTLYRLPISENSEERVLEPIGRLALPARGRMYETTGADLQRMQGGVLALLTFGAIHLFEQEPHGEFPFRQIHRITLDLWRTGQAVGVEARRCA
jgi:hypothetical protein